MPYVPAVPFYHQYFDFSCGPASLMMALGALKPGYRPNRDEELAIWREATLIEIYGTSRYGLALAAVRRDMRATAVGRPGVCYMDAMGDQRSEVDLDMIAIFQADLRGKALVEGVRELPEDMSMELIEDTLARGGLPIVLTTTALFDPDESDIPHWVLVSAIEGEHLIIENPLGQAGGTRFNREAWEANLGFGGIREGLLVYLKEGHNTSAIAAIEAGR